MQSLVVIGAGKVGQVLARRFHEARQFTVLAVLNRSYASAAKAVAFIGAGQACQTPAELPEADSYLLAVSDDQLTAAALMLPASLNLHDKVIWHCSGALAARHLASLSSRGALLASCHPVRSFADPTQAYAGFAGTLCACEGEPRALALLLPALQAAGADVFQLDAEHKALYHAAAVMANNYLVSLLDSAALTYQAAGLPAALAKQLTLGLAQQGLQNVQQFGSERALTGPVARADWQTVARHQAALQAHPQLAALYQAFLPLTQALAERQRAGQAQHEVEKLSTLR